MKVEIAFAAIMEEVDANAPFIFTSFFSDRFGRAACSAAFKRAGLEAFGYKKEMSVWKK